MLLNLSECKVPHVPWGNPNVKYSMGGVSLEEVTKESHTGLMVTESYKSSKQCDISAA